MTQMVETTDSRKVATRNALWLLAERAILTNAVCFELEADKAGGGNYLGTRTSAALGLLHKWVGEHFPDSAGSPPGRGLDQMAAPGEEGLSLKREIQAGARVCSALAYVWTADSQAAFKRNWAELDAAVQIWRAARDAARRP